jgi:tetratricopeptide (TPR) repeat protein
MAGKTVSASRYSESPDRATGQSQTPDGFALAAATLRADRPRNPRLKRIAAGLRGRDIARAEDALREYLLRHSDDAEGMFLMAQTEARRGRPRKAVSLLDGCLERAPTFPLARFTLAKLLVRLHRYSAALGEVERLLASDPRNPLFRQLRASILGAVGEDDESLAIWQGLAEEFPGRAELWIRCGDGLRALGRQPESLAAYRRAIACRPSYGLAWWSLANMKTVHFDEADIHFMRAQLDGAGPDAEDRANLRFALAKAYEDHEDYGKAFEQYAKGNAARRLQMDFDWDEMAAELSLQKALFTPEFLESRRGAGCTARDPIFVLGRPRAGSTLVEQILSSHSAVEGTAELPYIADLAFGFVERGSVGGNSGYPGILAAIDPIELAAMGEGYIGRAAIHRKLGRPHFIDKAPANYHHVGLIALILPNAKIVDARRNPAACCFSMFKHNYVETNLRQNELGRVWRDYAELMAHFDRVLPGRIHRVIYEKLISDPRDEIRRLLDFLELPFEESCLSFHQTKRTVRTPSSEQVRRPLSAEAVDHWRHFEPWLKPLLNSLGSALERYPDVPEELR